MRNGQGRNAVHNVLRDAIFVAVDFHPSFNALWRGFWSLHQGCAEARPLLPQFMLESFYKGSPLTVFCDWQFVIDEQGLHGDALLVGAHASPACDQRGFDVKQIQATSYGVIDHVVYGVGARIQCGHGRHQNSPIF